MVTQSQRDQKEEKDLLDGLKDKYIFILENWTNPRYKRWLEQVGIKTTLTHTVEKCNNKTKTRRTKSSGRHEHPNISIRECKRN